MKKSTWIILILALVLGLTACGGGSAQPEEQTACADVERYLREVIDSDAVINSCMVERTESDEDGTHVLCRTEFTVGGETTGGEIRLLYTRHGSGWELQNCRAALDDAAGAKVSLSKPQEFEGHSYCVYHLERIHSWEDAAAFCEDRGGHLATITSAEENAFLYSIIRKCGLCTAYFGLSDAEQEGEWKWITGEPLDYTNWNTGEPNNSGSGENEAAFDFLDNTGRWNDGKIGVAQGGNAFVCEWDSVVQTDAQG